MNECCGKCKRFGIHGEPRLHKFASGHKFGWIHHCEFDAKKTDRDGDPCDKYVDQEKEQNERELAKMAVAEKYMAYDAEPLQQAELF